MEAQNNDGWCVLKEAVTAINNNAAYKDCPEGSAYTGIQLPNGTINSGSIWLSRAANIQGNGLTASFINFTSSGTGCGVTASVGVTLTNLTLQQGPGFSITGLCGVGGLVTLNGVRVRLFQNSGIAMFGGSLSGNNIRVENNHSFGDGGGIWVDAPAQMSVITNISITNNTTPDSRGGGIAVFAEFGSPALDNCTISGNNAYQGGGIFSNGAYLDVRHCTIASNTATEGGGILPLPTQNYIRISQSTIVSNSAPSGANFYGYGPPGTQTANAMCNLWGDHSTSFRPGFSMTPTTKASPVRASRASPPVCRTLGPHTSWRCIPSNPAPSRGTSARQEALRTFVGSRARSGPPPPPSTEDPTSATNATLPLVWGTCEPHTRTLAAPHADPVERGQFRQIPPRRGGVPRRVPARTTGST